MLHHDKFVKVQCVGGLGNRLLGMISCLRLAKIQNIPLYVEWIENIYSCHYTLLFQQSESPHFIPYYTPQVYCYHPLHPNHTHEDEHFSYYSNNLPITAATGGGGAIKLINGEKITPHNSYATSTEHITDPIYQEIRDAFQTIQLAPGITEAISKYVAQYDDDTIGIHLRKKMMDHRHLPQEDSQIHKLVEKHDKFYLSTDCKPTENRFRKRYGSKMVCLDKQERATITDYTLGIDYGLRGVYPPLAVKEAFIDILCLSKTNKNLWYS